jgi:hypothetical protein
MPAPEWKQNSQLFLTIFGVETGHAFIGGLVSLALSTDCSGSRSVRDVDNA